MVVATRTLLGIMADGVPRSIPQLAEMTGMTVYKVTHTVDYLRDRGQIAPSPRVYVLTQAGRDRLAPKKLKPRPNRKRAPDERVLRPWERRRIAEQVVATAKSAPHPLASVWSAA